MSGHPTCSIDLHYAPGRKFFTAGDDLSGKITFKTTVDGQRIQHQGIKVSLLGMILQVPDYMKSTQMNSAGMIKEINYELGDIDTKNISQFRQYVFMQIQKEAEFSGEFTDKKTIEFSFKNLEDELKDHETYNGIDNFVKYFIRVNMNYEGGSMFSGNNLEILQEFEVKNYN